MRIKTVLKRASVIILAFAITISLSLGSTIAADKVSFLELDYYPFENARLSGGISVVKYAYTNPNGYVNSNSLSYPGKINLACNSWQSALQAYSNFQYVSDAVSDCNIYFAFVNSSTGLYSNNEAGCRCYSASGTELNPANGNILYPTPTSDYSYVYVFANQANIRNISVGNLLQAIFAHEIGHVLSLPHIASTELGIVQSLMFEYSNYYYSDRNYYAYTPCNADVLVARYAYGY